MTTLKFKTTDDWRQHATPPCDIVFTFEDVRLEDHPKFRKPFAHPRFRHARVRRQYAKMIESGITHFVQPIVIITKP
jgi:hypothetical protein